MENPSYTHGEGGERERGPLYNVIGHPWSWRNHFTHTLVNFAVLLYYKPITRFNTFSVQFMVVAKYNTHTHWTRHHFYPYRTRTLSLSPYYIPEKLQRKAPAEYLSLLVLLTMHRKSSALWESLANSTPLARTSCKNPGYWVIKSAWLRVQKCTKLTMFQRKARYDSHDLCSGI